MTLVASYAFLGCCRKLAILSSVRGITLEEEGMEALDSFAVALSSGLRLKLTDLGVPCVDVFVVIFAFFAKDRDS